MTNPDIPVSEWRSVRAALAEQLKAGHGGRLEEPTRLRMAEHLLDQGVIDVELLRPPRTGPARQVLAEQVNTYASVVVEVEAVQWDGTADHAGYIIDWVLAGGGTANYVGPGEEHDLRSVEERADDLAPFLVITTEEGRMRQNVLDWTIRGTEGEHYPCKPSVFARKYRAVAP